MRGRGSSYYMNAGIARLLELLLAPTRFGLHVVIQQSYLFLLASPNPSNLVFIFVTKRQHLSLICLVEFPVVLPCKAAVSVSALGALAATCVQAAKLTVHYSSSGWGGATTAP